MSLNLKFCAAQTLLITVWLQWQMQREKLQARCDGLEARMQGLQQRCTSSEASTVSLELQVGLLQQRLHACSAQLAEKVITTHELFSCQVEQRL